PITRRRFSQNERSLFGFLASAEPSGFTEFLQRTTLASGRTFGPAELWDYLQVNLEPAIMASPDGHRWAQAAEAIARAGRDGTHLRLQIAKTVAVIDLFSNGSGLAASSRTIAASLGHSDADVEEQLADLVKISALVYRRHLGAYAIYAGSDFDIEGEIEARIAERGRLEIASLNDLASLQPILAKRHYAEYGTPRWFDAQIGELAPQGLGPKDVRVSAGAAGKFLLLLPGIDVDPGQAEASLIEVSRTEHRHGLPVIVGLASNSADIRKTAIELEAARDVRNESPELAGDAAARREIDARIAHLSAQLEGLLREGFERAHWFDTGKPLDLQSLSYGLSQAASDIARRIFRQAPIVHSELINRRRPSSNSNAALRALLHAIVVGRGEQHFGIKGYPAEKGLAVTVLERAGLYVRQGERWDFVPPGETSTFAPLWSLTDGLLEAGEQVGVADIYRAWGEPPYGVQQGVMPLLLVTYLFSRRHSTAIYAKEAFQPAISDLVMDLLLQDPDHIALRSVPTDAANAVALKEFAAVASEFVEEAASEEPLEIAQALVQFAYSLP
ncbi:MAG TPA: ATP-binding protein, partial [Erythrobacter sp.]|nr:ATP-binding protein [Erythrobacter sp.]